MAKFNDDHKKDLSGNFIPEGVHKVKITAVTLGMTQDDKEYMEFMVQDAEGNEDKARVWFTTDKAIGYSFNIIRGILVHNAALDKKDAARAAVDKVVDTEELEKACQNLIGKECWFSSFKNPSRTYTKADGSTGVSYDRNIYGYEPNIRPAVAAEPGKASDVPFESGDKPFAENF